MIFVSTCSSSKTRNSAPRDRRTAVRGTSCPRPRMILAVLLAGRIVRVQVEGFGVASLSSCGVRRLDHACPLRVLASEEVEYGSTQCDEYGSVAQEEDITYQTNLKIGELAKQTFYNASAAIAAQELLDGLEQPDTVGYNGVLKAYAKSPDSDSAWLAEQLLGEMERVNEHQVYQNRLWYKKRALGDLTQHELDAGPPPITVSPNVRSYSTVLDAFSRGKDRKSAEKALDLLLRMEDIYEQTGNEGCRPNAVSYNTVIAALAKSGDGEHAALRAQDILQSMEERGMADVISYNAVILAWARSGVPDAGEHAEALLRNMTGDILPNTRTYSTVIDAWSRSVDETAVHRAHAILNQMEELYRTTGDEKVRPNTISYSSVINAYALSKEPGKAAMACTLLKHMKELYISGENVKAKPSLVTYNCVLNACATTTQAVERDDEIDLKQVVRSIYHELTEESQDLWPDHFTYGTLLKACANLLCGEPDNPDFVKEIFERCCDDGQVSFGVCYQLRQASPSELYRSLIPPQAYNNKNGHFSLKDMPREWRRNVRDNRRSKKYKN